MKFIVYLAKVLHEIIRCITEVMLVGINKHWCEINLFLILYTVTCNIVPKDEKQMMSMNLCIHFMVFCWCYKTIKPGFWQAAIGGIFSCSSNAW